MTSQTFSVTFLCVVVCLWILLCQVFAEPPQDGDQQEALTTGEGDFEPGNTTLTTKSSITITAIKAQNHTAIHTAPHGGVATTIAPRIFTKETSPEETKPRDPHEHEPDKGAASIVSERLYTFIGVLLALVAVAVGICVYIFFIRPRRQRSRDRPGF